jgi:hypothetical protein
MMSLLDQTTPPPPSRAEIGKAHINIWLGGGVPPVNRMVELGLVS